MLDKNFFQKSLYQKYYLIKNNILFLGTPIYDYNKNPIAVYVACFKLPSFFLQKLSSTIFIIFSILIPLNIFYLIVLNAEVIKPLRFINAELKFIEEIIGQSLITFSDEIKIEKLFTGTSKEINLLIKRIYKIIEKMKDVISFRHTIEKEKNSRDIFLRLSYLLKHKFNLKNFIIFEISNSLNKMTPVIKHLTNFKETEIELCKNPESCHVVQTMGIASNFKAEEICLYVNKKKQHTHKYLCLPIKSENKVIAVVCICLEKNTDIEERNRLIMELSPYLEISSNIIAIKKYAEVLHKAALHDYLTGLYNRRVLKDFTKHIEAWAKRNNKEIGILMADIDHFKRVNDIYGHRAGDFVLKDCANLIKNLVRASDIIIRYGGEEFLILLNDINFKGLITVGEKIRKKIEENVFNFQDKTIKVTISIGGAIFPKHGNTIEKVIEIADQALYQAKSSGRNKLVVWE